MVFFFSLLYLFVVNDLGNVSIKGITCIFFYGVQEFVFPNFFDLYLTLERLPVSFRYKEDLLPSLLHVFSRRYRWDV